MSTNGSGRNWRELGSGFLSSLRRMPLQRVFGRQNPSRHEPGEVPGTLVMAPQSAPTRIRLVRIDDAGVKKVDGPDMEAIRRAREAGGRLWVDVSGFSDLEVLHELGRIFGLHRMTLADLVNVNRRTTVEQVGETSIIVSQVLHLGDGEDPSDISQLGLVMMGEVLLTFRERPGPLFRPVLERMKQPASRLRTEPLDYLAQALLGVAVDEAFPVVEALTDRVENIEDRVVAGESKGLLADIHGELRALITLARMMWRQRDLMARLLRDESIFRRETQIYLRDVYDRTVQLLDMVETNRDLTAHLIEIHLSISANQSNEIMKTLTIMATIFIPLTFVAGVYGMNFERMPELEWPWGYPLVMFGMLLVAAALLLWFRRRGWLGGD